MTKSGTNINKETKEKKEVRKKEMEIKILLWNAREWKNKKEEIVKRIQDYDVCIITEIKNKIKKDFKIPGFIVIINTLTATSVTGD